MVMHSGLTVQCSQLFGLSVKAKSSSLVSASFLD
jgi:hypothetical protein